MATSRPVRAILVGAGNRGSAVYGRWAARHPERLSMVGVAEPLAERRAAFAAEHGIPAGGTFADWRELLSSGIEAEACLVCTQDRDHVEPALAALAAGYDVLLEKPMAATAADCLRLADAAESSGRLLSICHVARYTDFFRAVKASVESGAVGFPIHIAHSENVSYWHFAHSFVRGPWRREGDSSPIVLAKTCHDLDLLHWIAGAPAERVQSFGNLSFFRRENAPAGAPERCLDGCPRSCDCLWHVERIYGRGRDLIGVALRSGNPALRGAAKLAIAASGALARLGPTLPAAARLAQWRSWPSTVVSGDTSPDAMRRALLEGPFGRCVFACDNDAPDHQVVSIEFEGGLTATMAMEGLADLDGRWIRIDGSEATLSGSFTYAGERLELREHRSGRLRLLHRRGFTGDAHGGGDGALLADFAARLSARNASGGDSAAADPTGAKESLESHLMGFAADISRREGRVVRMDEMRRTR
jgi:predicted dehydrogenase